MTNLEQAIQQQAPAPPVMPQPVPMSIQLTTNQDFVIMIIHHPMGQTVLHFDAAGAERIADAMRDNARLAKTGLQIASSIDGGHGHAH